MRHRSVGAVIELEALEKRRQMLNTRQANSERRVGRKMGRRKVGRVVQIVAGLYNESVTAPRTQKTQVNNATGMVGCQSLFRNRAGLFRSCAPPEVQNVVTLSQRR